MKIRKVTYRKGDKNNGFLTAFCYEGSEVLETKGVMIGSQFCTERCPLFCCRIGNFIICRKNKGKKTMHKEFIKYGSPSVRLIEECSEVQKVCCKIERFGLDDWNPLVNPIKTNRTKIIDELSDLEIAIKNMKEYIESIPAGSQRLRKDKEEA